MASTDGATGFRPFERPARPGRARQGRARRRDTSGEYRIAEPFLAEWLRRGDHRVRDQARASRPAPSPSSSRTSRARRGCSRSTEPPTRTSSPSTDAPLREAFAAHAGVEVDTQGDAFFVAFARATDAVAAAADSRDALEGGPIRVRIGVHTGEPQATDEGYVGIDVHRAARIAAAAHGGQIVVSEATRKLLAGDADVRDLGEHRLKDLTGAERLYQLGAGDFPPLRTLDATNLPVVSIPLVGREQELEELVALLSNGTRLLTRHRPRRNRKDAPRAPGRRRARGDAARWRLLGSARGALRSRSC